MKTTKEIFQELEQDAINIACLGSHLLEQIKERDKEIEKLKLEKKQLALRLEQINNPLNK